MNQTLPDDQRIAALRTALPATGAGIYLDVATAGPLPAETDRALREADDWELRVGRGGPDHAADAELRREEARGVVAAILGVLPDQVVVAMGLRAVTAAVLEAVVPAGGTLSLASGLEPGVAAAARAVSATRGWRQAEMEAPDGPGPAGGVLLVPAVRAHDGVPVDVAALVGRARASGWRVVADLSMAAGTVDLAIAALGVDAAVLATDRWLLGPDGTAAAWLAPSTGAVGDVGRRLDPLPRRMALGVARSLGWQLMYVGLPWMVGRTRGAAARLRSRLSAIAGVTLLGPATEPAAISAFDVEGWPAADVADELGRRVFAIVGCTGDRVRASVGAWTTHEEVERFADAVALIAAHTPDTLPRREPLVILGQGSARG